VRVDTSPTSLICSLCGITLHCCSVIAIAPKGFAPLKIARLFGVDWPCLVLSPDCFVRLAAVSSLKLTSLATLSVRCGRVATGYSPSVMLPKSSSPTSSVTIDVRFSHFLPDSLFCLWATHSVSACYIQFSTPLCHVKLKITFQFCCYPLSSSPHHMLLQCVMMYLICVMSLFLWQVFHAVHEC
jgi:hypothetical protein